MAQDVLEDFAKTRFCKAFY